MSDRDPRAPGDDAPAARSLDDLLADLEAHLAATEELPIDPAANRWIGEAEAVAADLAGDPDVPEAVVARRVGHVRDLLERMGDPESEAAREHVAAALSAVDAIEARIDGG